MEAKGLTVLVIMVAMCALVASASAPPTPFMIYGYVSYENGTACNGSVVNITNLDNFTKEWSADTNAGYNYYQLMLANGTDVNASEVLRFEVTSPDGSQANITEHEVTQENITDGGLFSFNITLEALIHDINVSTDYTGAVDGVRIENETGETIPAGQNLTIGEKYYIKYKIVNEGDFNESVNITVSVSNATEWNQTIDTHNWTIKVGASPKYGNDTWLISELSPGNYNITVNASIPVDDDWFNNERRRQVTLVSPDLNITYKSEEWVNVTHFNVTYTIANIGGGDAGASNTTIYINGTNVLEDPVPALASGANYTNTVGPFQCPCGQTLNVTVCADNGNVIEESNETNNCMINMFECPSCPCVPAIEVNKTVWNGTAWVETIPDAEINNTYRFKCEVHNNGTCCNLTNIKVEDNLSDSLKYAKNATVDGVAREPNWTAGNQFGWNFTEPLLPCETIVIEFDATVIDCGNDSNVQNATAYCPETEKWVSDEDDAWINVPDGTVCGYGDWEQDPANQCQERRQMHRCIGGECTPTDDYEYQPANEGEICGYGEWEDVEENPCQEMREIHRCVEGQCTPSGEYEYQNKIIPDLVITEKYETFGGGNFTVNYTIKNIGGGDANASNTTIYINGSNAIEDPVPALSPGENYTNTVGPFECPCDGTLNITVCADNGNAVGECNETNNCKVNIVECPLCPKPDLNITNKFETLIDGGKNFTVNYTVKNIGDGAAGASNTTIYIDGVNVSEDPVPSLALGENYTNTVGPFDCPCDETLNVTVCADNGNEVNESDETNNCMINEFMCPSCPKPDLNITDKYETLEDGTFTVNYTVKNIGAGGASASNTTIYINGANALEDPVPSLALGENYTNTVGHFDCPCGETLNVTVCADNGNAVDESDETNNCMINIFKCPDTTPPEVFDYAPTGTNVPVTTNVTATFSEAVNESTLSNETIKVKNSTGIRVEGTITYDSDNFTATIDPLSNLEYSETYNVTITMGVQDLAGNNMSSNITWNFTTWEPDLVISGQWVNWPENCTICYNITNIGNGTVLAGHNTTLYVDGNETAHDVVPVNLAPNESYIGCFDYNWTFTPPQDNITVCADNNNTVQEINESNNCMNRTYKCGDVDEDGDRDNFDVGVLWHDAYRTPINGWAEDVDGNGYVTIWDMSLLWQAYKRGGASWEPINCYCTEMGG